VTPPETQEHAIWRLGVVSYLNSRPLVEGLDGDPQVEMTFDVPARLATLLDEDRVDVALVPVVDLVRCDRNWQIVSNACIGCDGETLTVRVFSRAQPETIRRLHVDGDSHTSVLLANVLWKAAYGTDLEILPLEPTTPRDECEAILLIGDKVVNNDLLEFETETDLGSAWKSLTGLPFVFAVWAAPAAIDVQVVAGKLSHARDAGVQVAEMIAADYGPGLGFPVRVATRYLTSRLKFTLGSRQREGMERFFQLAKDYGLIPAEKELLFA